MWQFFLNIFVWKYWYSLVGLNYSKIQIHSNIRSFKISNICKLQIVHMNEYIHYSLLWFKWNQILPIFTHPEWSSAIIVVGEWMTVMGAAPLWFGFLNCSWPSASEALALQSQYCSEKMKSSQLILSLSFINSICTYWLNICEIWNWQIKDFSLFLHSFW